MARALWFLSFFVIILGNSILYSVPILSRLLLMSKISTFFRKDEENVYESMRKFDWWSEFESSEDSYNSNSVREFRYDWQCVIIQSKVQASMKKKVYDVTVGILCHIFSFFKFFFYMNWKRCHLLYCICVYSQEQCRATSRLIFKSTIIVNYKFIKQRKLVTWKMYFLMAMWKI